MSQTPAGTPLPKDFAESEARFRALVTATSDVVYRMSADWKTMRELEGAGFLSDTGEPIDNWLEKYIHPKDQERVRLAIAEAISNKSMFHLEHQVLNIDGTLGWTLSRAVPILNEAGEIIEWFGSAKNVTPRRKIEEDLRLARDEAEQQKRLYETITSNTPDLIYVFDLDYRFTYANDALLNMWGKTWDDAIGRKLLENGYEPWHAEMHEREIDTVVATKRPIRGEVSFPHATQGRRVYDYIFSPVINDEGEVIAIAGTTRDITDIKLAEDTMAESEARFRTMAEGTNIYIATADETGKAIYFNNAWSKLTGRPTEQLLDFGWADLMQPDDKERYVKNFLEATKKQRPFHTDMRVMSKEGKYRWLLVDAAVRKYADGSFAGFITSSIDMTELKEDEQRKNDFISMVSHELKTPLTSALSYVQISKKKISKTDDVVTANMLDRTEKQLAKMARMINGFLNVSRLESGKIQIDRQRFDISALLKEVKADSLSYIFNHRLRFEQAQETWVNADREKIEQVIQNFISNAVKYSPTGSNIYINCVKIADKVVVSVKDEGMGIRPDDMAKIFDRYYRVKDVQQQHISGFGIGLYLSAEIIKRHGGDIWVESAENEGSTFLFSLPVVQ